MLPNCTLAYVKFEKVWAKMTDMDQNIEMWKIKKLIKSLEAARGNGTSMISLIIPVSVLFGITVPLTPSFLVIYSYILSYTDTLITLIAKGTSFSSLKDVGWWIRHGVEYQVSCE